MLIRKVKKGVYEILLEDTTDHQYRVEDQRQIGAMGESYVVAEPWAVWEKIEGDDDFWKLGPELDEENYKFITSEESFKDCIFTISLWEEANEYIN